MQSRRFDGAILEPNTGIASHMQAVIFIGLQASGKSSFYRHRFFRTHVRVNLDMLKTRSREQGLFEACLALKQPVVIDNTNPSTAERARYIGPAKAAGFCVAGYYFESKAAACIERNAQRPEDERVPEVGIRGTSGRLELPTRAEGFDELYYVRLDGGQFVIEEWRDEL